LDVCRRLSGIAGWQCDVDVQVRGYPSSSTEEVDPTGVDTVEIFLVGMFFFYRLALFDAVKIGVD
jgi:hypothetical protein